VNVIRCEALVSYSGSARISAGVIGLAHLLFCISIASASFVTGNASVVASPPWRNCVWFCTVVVMLGLTALYIFLSVEKGAGSALPWYLYVLVCTTPWICLAWSEALKRVELKQLRRAEKLRRLQFETRLGAWSPR
jgi:hypothetical protein